MVSRVSSETSRFVRWAARNSSAARRRRLGALERARLERDLAPRRRDPGREALRARRGEATRGLEGAQGSLARQPERAVDRLGGEEDVAEEVLDAEATGAILVAEALGRRVLGLRPRRSLLCGSCSWTAARVAASRASARARARARSGREPCLACGTAEGAPAVAQ